MLHIFQKSVYHHFGLLRAASVCFLTARGFDPKDGRSTFIRNLVGPLPEYTALHTRR